MSDEYLVGMGGDIEAIKPAAYEQLLAVNNEDVQATEYLQQTTKSRLIDRGPITPVELSLLYFYRYLAEQLTVQ